MTTPEAMYVKAHGTIQTTLAADIDDGEVTQLDDGRALVSIGAGDDEDTNHSHYVCGLFDLYTAAADDAIAVGDDVWWDKSADAAVSVATEDSFYAGKCVVASASNRVRVDLNVNPRTTLGAVQVSKPVEIDCEDGETNANLKLLAEGDNPNGILIRGIFGVVTEAFAGGTEDQGILTISDESDNALGTLTVSDAGADALGDVVVGTNSLNGASTGDPLKTVSAGEYVDVAVTQATSGTSAAGKMKVWIEYQEYATA